MLVLTCPTFPMLLRLKNAGEISVFVCVKLDLVTLKSLLVHFSRSVVSNSLWPHEPQHARPPCPSPTHGVHPNPCALSWWCHPTISSSVVPFSSCLQSFPVSGSFPMSQLFASGDQSIGASASASVLNIQGWFPLGLTGLISLKSKGLSRVFSSTTGQKLYFSKKIKHAETLKELWVSTQRLSFQALHFVTLLHHLSIHHSCFWSISKYDTGISALHPGPLQCVCFPLSAFLISENFSGQLC